MASGLTVKVCSVSPLTTSVENTVKHKGAHSNTTPSHLVGNFLKWLFELDKTYPVWLWHFNKHPLGNSVLYKHPFGESMILKASSWWLCYLDSRHICNHPWPWQTSSWWLCDLDKHPLGDSVTLKTPRKHTPSMIIKVTTPIQSVTPQLLRVQHLSTAAMCTFTSTCAAFLPPLSSYSTQPRSSASMVRRERDRVFTNTQSGSLIALNLIVLKHCSGIVSSTKPIYKALLSVAAEETGCAWGWGQGGFNAGCAQSMDKLFHEYSCQEVLS